MSVIIQELLGCVEMIKIDEGAMAKDKGVGNLGKVGGRIELNGRLREGVKGRHSRLSSSHWPFV